MPSSEQLIRWLESEMRKVFAAPAASLETKLREIVSSSRSAMELLDSVQLFLTSNPVSESEPLGLAEVKGFRKRLRNLLENQYEDLFSKQEEKIGGRPRKAEARNGFVVDDEPPTKRPQMPVRANRPRLDDNDPVTLVIFNVGEPLNNIPDIVKRFGYLPIVQVSMVDNQTFAVTYAEPRFAMQVFNAPRIPSSVLKQPQFKCNLRLLGTTTMAYMDLECRPREVQQAEEAGAQRQAEREAEGQRRREEARQRKLDAIAAQAKERKKEALLRNLGELQAMYKDLLALPESTERNTSLEAVEAKLEETLAQLELLSTQA